jgi:hypothetical protein
VNRNGDPEFVHARAVVAGLARAASMTPEELSNAGRQAAQARWARYRADREAQGLSGTKRPPREEMSADQLAFWLEQVDAKHPDRAWPNHEARRRAALMLAKEEQARMIMERKAKGTA